MEKIEKGHPLTQSADIVKENLETLKQLFPTIVKEGKIEVDELKALLDEEVENNEEYFRFTWAGKSDARREANKPSTATLRPNKTDSKNWNTTGNIFIEGDNLEVLKLMQKSYAGKIKMMYFDPPYNTGKDFVYKDDYKDNLGNYLALSKQIDDAGNKLSTNTESDGRYHSNWLNMMYPRLKLARNLLAEDGVIFISIDDNEVFNLQKTCNEIFGDENFVGCFIWRGGRRNAAKVLSTSHEYMLCYSKNIRYCFENNIEWRERKKGLQEIYNKVEELTTKYKTDFVSASKELQLWYSSLKEDDPSKNHDHYSWIDKNGVYFASDISRGGGGGPTWEIKNPITNEIVNTPQRGWAYSTLENLMNDIKNDIIHFNGNSVPCKKIYLKDKEIQLAETVFYKDRRGSSKRLRSLLDGNLFDFPKDEFVIAEKIEAFTQSNDIILDIFSGSGTTAHSVLIQNAKDGGKRKFICVQIPEPTDEKSEAYKAGYKNIAEISKERIRRAGEKVKSEINTDLFSGDAKDLDIGFKAFKLDSSNIHAWDGSVENFEVNLFNAQNNIKEDRTEEDVLFEILLKYGLDLTVPIEEKKVNASTVYCIGGGVLFVCLSDNITTNVAEAIGKWKTELQPATCRVLFKDNGFKDDIAKTNSVQLLKQFGIEETNSI